TALHERLQDPSVSARSLRRQRHVVPLRHGCESTQLRHARRTRTARSLAPALNAVVSGEAHDAPARETTKTRAICPVRCIRCEGKTSALQLTSAGARSPATISGRPEDATDVGASSISTIWALHRGGPSLSSPRLVSHCRVLA